MFRRLVGYDVGTLVSFTHIHVACFLPHYSHIEAFFHRHLHYFAFAYAELYQPCMTVCTLPLQSFPERTLLTLLAGYYQHYSGTFFFLFLAVFSIDSFKHFEFVIIFFHSILQFLYFVFIIISSFSSSNIPAVLSFNSYLIFPPPLSKPSKSPSSIYLLADLVTSLCSISFFSFSSITVSSQ